MGDFRLHCLLSGPRHRELLAWTRTQHITEQMFHAVDDAGLRITAIHHMDEYTIDIVVPLPDGLVLVYDTT